MRYWMGVATVLSVTAVVGTCLQLLFWKTDSLSVFEALLRNYGLWVVYFLASGLLSEHFFKVLNRSARLPKR